MAVPKQLVRARGSKWKSDGASARTNIGISSGFTGYTSRPDVRLIGVPALPRLHEALNLAWAKQMLVIANPLATTSDLQKNFWFDVSQGVGRKLTSSLTTFGRPGTLCNGGLWFSFEEGVVLDGEDFLRLQGWPRAIYLDETFTSSEKRELGSEGFHLGCFASVLYGFYINKCAPWWHSAA